jgi:hypothetical protein
MHRELCLFQMMYEDGVERLGAGSPRERMRWPVCSFLVAPRIWFINLNFRDACALGGGGWDRYPGSTLALDVMDAASTPT